MARQTGTCMVSASGFLVHVTWAAQEEERGELVSTLANDRF